MNRGLFTVLTALLLVAGMHAQQQVTVSGYGWTVTADPAQSTVTVEHERLGQCSATFASGSVAPKR